jgi:apolipoprotein N-acyltransferase
VNQRNFLFAIVSGFLLWLSWPTYGFAGLLFIAFVPLLMAQRSIKKRKVNRGALKVFVLSYLTFFIWNIGATYWLYFSTAFGMWFAVLVNSLLMSLVFQLYHQVSKRTTTWASLTSFISIWMVFEWMHLHWDFSWPWLNLGNGFSDYLNWVQWYEYTGVAGGSLWVLLVNVVIYRGLVYAQNLLRSRSKLDSTIRSRKIVKKFVLPILMIVLPIVGSYILIPGEASLTEGKVQNVLILQPNIDPYSEKYRVSNTEIASGLNELINPRISSDTDLIIGPETVLADHMRIERFMSDPAVKELKTILNKFPRASFIGGASFLEIFKDEKEKKSFSNYDERSMLFYNDYNSAFKIGANQLTETYHKSKLVVGVEHFPYRSILEPLLGDAMINLGGSTATKGVQDQAKNFTITPEIKAAPIICYESVYGEYVGDFVKSGANLLAIITNDAWWDNTQGHKQHLSLARLRAVEHRRWIARSANTGVSAIINPKGQIIKKLGYNKRGSISGKLYTSDQLTFYSKYGDYLSRVAGFMALFILLFSFLTKKQNEEKIV